MKQKIFLLFLVLDVQFALGSQAVFEPPPKNPHPPVTEADKNRVAFADLALKTLLTKNLPVTEANKMRAKETTLTMNEAIDLNLTVSCIKNQICIDANLAVFPHVAAIFSNYGLATEIRHTHIIPWSFENFKKISVGSMYPPASDSNDNVRTEDRLAPPAPMVKAGEYLIHSYVKFNDGWHHVDIVVSENAKGNLMLKRFFVMPEQRYDDLPSGSVC